MKRNYPNIGLHVPTLLLPAPQVPLASWSVIACDQHTSQPEYWHETARLAGDHPSTLRLVLPEAHLAGGDRAAAVAAINARMQDYTESGVLVEQPPGFMLVERQTGRETPRRGLVVALDLECFDYRAEARKLIRSTEGTDASRLPARIAVRRDASLETSHILVLIDDPERTVIEPLFERGANGASAAREPAYDVELMQGGGRLRGWRLDDEETIAGIAQNLARLQCGEPPLLYAMGDGNHSFAAARAVWEALKAEGAGADHPGRYASVELVNLHDQALHFAPIHRLVTGVDPATLFAAMADHFAAAGLQRESFSDRESWLRAQRDLHQRQGHCLPYLSVEEFGIVAIRSPQFHLAVASLQSFLDAFAAASKAEPEAAQPSIDYIHGDQTLEELARAPRNVGFLLPPMNKHDLFPTVVKDGATPRKTFSLGEAHEKRYYLECRRICL